MTGHRRRYRHHPSTGNADDHLGALSTRGAEEAGQASQYGYSQRAQQLTLVQQQQLRSEVDRALQDPNSALQNLTEIMRRNPDILATVPGLAAQLRDRPEFQAIREQLMTNLQATPNPLASGTQAMEGNMQVDAGQQAALIRHLGALGPRSDGASLQHERTPRALHAPAR